MCVCTFLKACLWLHHLPFVASRLFSIKQIRQNWCWQTKVSGSQRKFKQIGQSSAASSLSCVSANRDVISTAVVVGDDMPFGAPAGKIRLVIFPCFQRNEFQRLSLLRGCDRCPYIQTRQRAKRESAGKRTQE